MCTVKIKKKIEIENKDILTFDQPKISDYKCFTYYDNDQFHHKIFNELGKISKNIYNLSIYSIQIFNLFKIKLYENLYNELKKNNKINTSEFVKNKLIEYFELYSSIKDKLQNNNSYIYKFIINYITTNKIIIKNSNYENTKNYLFNILKKDVNIYLDGNNNYLLFDNIIIRIINSLYIKNHKIIEDEMLAHKKYSFNDDEIIQTIKDKKIMDFTINTSYKEKIENELKIELKSDQNYIGRLVYAKLDNNHHKLETTMICSIITKAYQSYTSFYALRNKGIKANQPKFLKKNDLYNLIYAYSKTNKLDQNNINAYTSTFMAKHFDEIFGSNFIKLSNNKYIDCKYLLNTNSKKILKKDNYIYKDKYVSKDNKNIIDSRYVKIYIPDKLKKYNIKVIEIVFENESIKICISYENNEKIDEKKIQIQSDESISIDMGVKNLMTIYDPTGTQKIIDGKYISSINIFYNKKIGDMQSVNNNIMVNKLNLKRKNTINNYFNLIAKWIATEYHHKKLIIIGYNKEWKQNSNLWGKNTNMIFNKIPYCKLIDKIKNKFIQQDKIVLTNEESYTSICDALSLEEICKHKNYLGNRTERGLFVSAKNKKINADINGAMNIMRKIFKNMKEIKGKKLCSPERINIFRDVINQRIRCNSGTTTSVVIGKNIDSLTVFNTFSH